MTNLKNLQNYIRKHSFISQRSTANFTTSQRRKFERDVYDFGRGLGLDKARIQKEQRKSKAFLSHETGYETDDTSYSQELDDSQQVVHSLIETQEKQRKQPSFLSVVDVGGKTAVLSSPPGSTSKTMSKPTPVLGSDLRVKYTLSVTFLPAPKYGKAVHTLSATEDRSNAKISGEVRVSQLHSHIGDWISNDLQEIVARNVHAVGEATEKARPKRTNVSNDKPVAIEMRPENGNHVETGPSTTKGKAVKQPKVHFPREEHNADKSSKGAREPRKLPQEPHPPRAKSEGVVIGDRKSDFEAAKDFCNMVDDIPTPYGSDSSSKESEAENAEKPGQSMTKRSKSSITGTKQTGRAQRSSITPPFPIHSGNRELQSKKSSTEKGNEKYGSRDKLEKEKEAMHAEARKTFDNFSAHRDNNNSYQLAAYNAGSYGPISKSQRADFEELNEFEHLKAKSREADKKMKKETRKKAEWKAEQKAEKKRKRSEEASDAQGPPDDDAQDNWSNQAQANFDVSNEENAAAGGSQIAEAVTNEPHSKRSKYKHMSENAVDNTDNAKKTAKKAEKAKKRKSRNRDDFQEPRTQ